MEKKNGRLKCTKLAVKKNMLNPRNERNTNKRGRNECLMSIQVHTLPNFLSYSSLVDMSGGTFSLHLGGEKSTRIKA